MLPFGKIRKAFDAAFSMMLRCTQMQIYHANALDLAVAAYKSLELGL